MPTEENRARRLGYDGESDPQNWNWGGPAQPVHDVLAVFAGTGDAQPEDWVRIQELIDAQLCRAHGVHVLTVLDTLASNVTRRKEHFGFRDGIANPRIAGLPRDRTDDTLAAGEAVPYVGSETCHPWSKPRGGAYFFMPSRRALTFLSVK